MSDDQLKEALHQIISNHIVFPYTSNSTDTWDIIQESDQDPNNNNNMLLETNDVLRSEDIAVFTLSDPISTTNYGTIDNSRSDFNNYS